MTLKNTEPLTVVLKEEATEMEEVVITGIYSRKKESFTGSSQTYTHKELKMIGNTNVLQSLKTIDPSFASLRIISSALTPILCRILMCVVKRVLSD